MDYLRQTMDSDSLNGLFDLPASLRNKKVEVIILPFKADEAHPRETGSAFGCLKKYANPSLIPLEEGAWGRAVKEKHDGRGRSDTL